MTEQEARGRIKAALVREGKTAAQADSSESDRAAAARVHDRAFGRKGH
jgi:hypothetical protein